MIYLYGYGTKKHIPDATSAVDRYGEQRSWCGNYGKPKEQSAFHDEVAERGVCKSCLNKQAKWEKEHPAIPGNIHAELGQSNGIPEITMAPGIIEVQS